MVLPEIELERLYDEDLINEFLRIKEQEVETYQKYDSDDKIIKFIDFLRNDLGVTGEKEMGLLKSELAFYMSQKLDDNFLKTNVPELHKSIFGEE